MVTVGGQTYESATFRHVHTRSVISKTVLNVSTTENKGQNLVNASDFFFFFYSKLYLFLSKES